MKFSIKDFFSKCDQIRSFLWIRSHLLKKSVMENFIFCAKLQPAIPWKTLIKSAYVKIDAYLLQFLCHMTSDVKCSYMLFLLIYIGVQKLYYTK